MLTQPLAMIHEFTFVCLTHRDLEENNLMMRTRTFGKRSCLVGAVEGRSLFICNLHASQSLELQFN